MLFSTNVMVWLRRIDAALLALFFNNSLCTYPVYFWLYQQYRDSKSKLVSNSIYCIAVIRTSEGDQKIGKPP